MTKNSEERALWAMATLREGSGESSNYYNILKNKIAGGRTRRRRRCRGTAAPRSQRTSATPPRARTGSAGVPDELCPQTTTSAPGIGARSKSKEEEEQEVCTSEGAHVRHVGHHEQGEVDEEPDAVVEDTEEAPVGVRGGPLATGIRYEVLCFATGHEDTRL